MVEINVIFYFVYFLFIILLIIFILFIGFSLYIFKVELLEVELRN